MAHYRPATRSTVQDIAHLPRTLHPASVLGLQSTGLHYPLQFALAAHAAALRIYALNSLDARCYAQSVRRRGKTDRIEALMLTRDICHELAQSQQRQPLPLDRLRCVNSSPTRQRWNASAVHWHRRAVHSKALVALASECFPGNQHSLFKPQVLFDPALLQPGFDCKP